MIRLALPSGWSFEDLHAPSHRRLSGILSGPDGRRITATLERCVAGRLAPAYPAGAHDVEVSLDAAADQLTEPLAVLGRAVLRADPRCHRVVYAAPADDRPTIAAAEAGGFRYVLDVDLPDTELSLLVLEPPSVTGQAAEVEQMPTSVQSRPLT
jgi:hypothetical protein